MRGETRGGQEEGPGRGRCTCQRVPTRGSPQSCFLESDWETGHTCGGDGSPASHHTASERQVLAQDLGVKNMEL